MGYIYVSQGLYLVVYGFTVCMPVAMFGMVGVVGVGGSVGGFPSTFAAWGEGRVEVSLGQVVGRLK